MIGLGSNRLTVCRRGGMSVTQAGRGGMEWLAGVRVPSWASPYSAQATAALKAQFPTQWPTIRDYGFVHPEIVGYMNAAPLMVGQMFANSDLYAVVQAGLMSLKTLQDNSMWLRILHHHVNNGANLFRNATDAEYRVSNDLFSILKYTGNFLLNSKYEFLAEDYMTEGSAAHTDHRWQQTTDPYTNTTYSGFVNISNTAAGIINHYKAYGRETLLSYRTNAAPSNWFGAAGCFTAWNGGIPSFTDGLNTPLRGTMDVWIRVS